jgi:hypothetical protein
VPASDCDQEPGVKSVRSWLRSSSEDGMDGEVSDLLRMLRARLAAPVVCGSQAGSHAVCGQPSLRLHGNALTPCLHVFQGIESVGERTSSLLSCGLPNGLPVSLDAHGGSDQETSPDAHTHATMDPQDRPLNASFLVPGQDRQSQGHSNGKLLWLCSALVPTACCRLARRGGRPLPLPW